MKKLLYIIIFFALWGFLYWVCKFNFGVISFIFTCLIVGAVGKNDLIFLAKEFDRNHNNLADTVDQLKGEVEGLSFDYEELQTRYDILQSELDDIKSNIEAILKPKGSDEFYDFIDEMEKENKAP